MFKYHADQQLQHQGSIQGQSRSCAVYHCIYWLSAHIRLPVAAQHSRSTLTMIKHWSAAAPCLAYSSAPCQLCGVTS